MCWRNPNREVKIGCGIAKTRLSHVLEEHDTLVCEAEGGDGARRLNKKLVRLSIVASNSNSYSRLSVPIHLFLSSLALKMKKKIYAPDRPLAAPCQF